MDSALAWAIRNEARIERSLTSTHRHIIVVTGPNAGVNLRLDRYLALALHLSRTLIQRWLEAGYGHCNERPIQAKYKVRAGDHIELLCPLPPGVFDTEEPPPLEILYEETGVIVVNKPPGLLAHQAGRHLSGTLLNQLQDLMTERGADPREARLVNRIDRDTSGIVLCTTDAAVHSQLSIALQAGEFHKEYRALCHGRPTQAHGHWRNPIRDDPTGASIAREVHPSGQECHTEYEVLEATPDDRYTLLRLILHTGRQHQIRVHAAANGHPLIGDWVYGPACHELLGQALHAAELEFPHPALNCTIRIEAPLTAALQRLWSHLQTGHEVTPRELAPDEASRLGLTEDTNDDADVLPAGWRRPSWLTSEELREYASACGDEHGDNADDNEKNSSCSH